MSAVLVVEDEKHLAEGLRFNLEAEGYTVETVGDGESAVALLTETPARFDAVVLDVMLPGMDGFAVAATLRGAGQFVPVLMLTARGHPEDVLRGFESGADDYLPKPFELEILLARLRGLLRRRVWLSLDRDRSKDDPTAAANSSAINNAAASDAGRQTPPGQRDAFTGVKASAGGSAATDSSDSLFRFGGKTIDFDALELRVRERTVRLTLMEVGLLRYLVQRAGRVVSRRSMLEEVWGLHEDTDTRAIDNFIVRLRKYIEDQPAKPKHLLTIRGVGYRFIPEPEEG